MIFKRHSLQVFVFLLAFALGTFVYGSKIALGAVSHLIISQIQISGTVANDEFVEIYNPTNSSVNLDGFKLKKKTSTGTESNLVSSMSGVISPMSYFLIAHPSYTGSVSEDFLYTSTSSGIAANNTVLLYNSVDTTPIDKVGMGTATDVESAAASVPDANASIQRKVDDTFGHGLDTDNNFNDFEVLAVSSPRNSTSVVVTPTASSSPTATPTSTPSASPTSSPTQTPTATPTGTAEPTSTPLVTPTVSPTQTPTSTPTSSPVVSPTPTASPTLSPSSTPHGSILGVFNFPKSKVICRVSYVSFRSRWFFGFFPRVFCTRV